VDCVPAVLDCAVEKGGGVSVIGLSVVPSDTAAVDGRLSGVILEEALDEAIIVVSGVIEGTGVGLPQDVTVDETLVSDCHVPGRSVVSLTSLEDESGSVVSGELAELDPPLQPGTRYS
jgi:hypothetical protein